MNFEIPQLEGPLGTHKVKVVKQMSSHDLDRITERILESHNQSFDNDT